VLTKQHIEVAHKFYHAQEAMKFLHGEKYEEKVAETSDVIKRVAEANKCDVLPATQICIEKIVDKFPYDNGFLVAILMATAVEMCEGSL
jgi:hypothetical protein